MTGTITKPTTWVAQLLASVTMLIVTMGMLSASALTMKEATAAYKQGDYPTALDGFWNYAQRGDPLRSMPAKEFPTCGSSTRRTAPSRRSSSTTGNGS